MPVCPTRITWDLNSPNVVWKKRTGSIKDLYRVAIGAVVVLHLPASTIRPRLQRCNLQGFRGSDASLGQTLWRFNHPFSNCEKGGLRTGNGAATSTVVFTVPPDHRRRLIKTRRVPPPKTRRRNNLSCFSATASPCINDRLIFWVNAFRSIIRNPKRERVSPFVKPFSI